MSPRWKNAVFLACSCLLLASLLTACQSGPVSRVHACNAQALPVVQTHQPITSLRQTVYATSGSHLYVLQASNGTLRWCRALTLDNGQPDQFASVTHVGDQLYTFTDAGIITALTAHAGTEVWSTNTGNRYYQDVGSTASPPSVTNETVYSGRTSLFALSTQDGGFRWHSPLPGNSVAVTVPVVSNGSVYIGTEFLSHDSFHCCPPSQLLALNAATGHTRWTFVLPQTPATFTRDLTVGGGVIVVQSAIEGHDVLDVVDAQSGTLLWQKALHVESLKPTLSIANGLLYVSASLPPNRRDAVDGLYAFDLHTGALRWVLPSQKAGLDPGAPIVVSKNVLYTIDRDEDVDTIDAVTGLLLWSAPLVPNPGETSDRLVLDDNELFIGAEFLTSTQFKFVLHAFNITTRTENWQADLTGGDADNVTGIDVTT